MPETQMNLEITPKKEKQKLCYSLALTNQTSLLYDERAMGLSYRRNWVRETMLSKGRKYKLWLAGR